MIVLVIRLSAKTQVADFIPPPASHSNDEQFKDIFFAKIDVDELPELSQELGIRAMPTFMLFKDGEKAEELVGANPNALVSLLQKFK